MRRVRLNPTFAFSLLSFAILSATGCPRTDPQVAAAPSDASAPALAAAAQTPPNASVSTLPLPPANPDAAADIWNAIGALTFSQRKAFIAGLGRLEKKLDVQVEDLKAKRATLRGNTDDWDFYMKALETARSYFQSLIVEAGQTPSDAWSSEKEKIHRAWQSAQNAYDQVRTSTTQ